MAEQISILHMEVNFRFIDPNLRKPLIILHYIQVCCHK